MIYKIRRLLKKHRIMKKLSKHIYYSFDLIHAIFHTNFELLCWFVEDGGIDDINWEWTEHHSNAYKIIMSNYKWYKEIYPYHQEKYDYYLDKFYGEENSKMVVTPCEDNKNLSNLTIKHFKYKDKKQLDLPNKIEEWLNDIKTKRLKQIMDIRLYMWT